MVLSNSVTWAQMTEPAMHKEHDTIPEESHERILNQIRPVHASYGFNLWGFENANCFHKDLLESDNSDPNVFSMQISLTGSLPVSPRNKSEKFILGIGYEWIRKDYTGMMDVEYMEMSGWLDFNPKEYGEILEMNHQVNIYSLIAGYQLRPYPAKRFIGTEITFLLPLRLYSIHEEENIEMQGNYSVIQTPDTEYLYYESDYYSRDNRLTNVSVKPGLRFDLYFGRYFSLIIPEISYELTVYTQKLDEIKYYSTVDDDQLFIPSRDHNMNTLVVTFGAGIHF